MPAPDPVPGNAGDNLLLDTDFASIVTGAAGNDVIVAYGGPAPEDFTALYDLFDGGAEFDTVSYALLNQRVFVDMDAGQAWRVRADGSLWAPDGFVSIEAVLGSGYDDTMLGAQWGDIFNGAGGDDSLDGAAGHDRLDGGNGADTLLGSAGNDTLNGGNGEDSLAGGDHADTLQGGYGDDTLNGGGGIDTVLFDTFEDVFVDLEFQYAESALGDDWLIGFENVVTGSGDDHVFGNLLANDLRVGTGDDLVFGLNGNDTVFGSGGDDTLHGGEDSDTLYGGADNDALNGDGDNDLLAGGTGDDVLRGGAGDDTLRGENGEDTLRGGGGDDVLNGGRNDDLLLGGAGADTINTGQGADIVRWEAGDDTGIDEIDGFVLGTDAISFGTGFFSTDPTSFAELADLLLVFPVAGDSFLLAHTDDGWETIARFDGIAGADLAAAIEDFSLFASGPGLGGGPDGFGFA